MIAVVIGPLEKFHLLFKGLFYSEEALMAVFSSRQRLQCFKITVSVVGIFLTFLIIFGVFSLDFLRSQICIATDVLCFFYFLLNEFVCVCVRVCVWSFPVFRNLLLHLNILLVFYLDFTVTCLTYNVCLSDISRRKCMSYFAITGRFFFYCLQCIIDFSICFLLFVLYFYCCWSGVLVFFYRIFCVIY